MKIILVLLTVPFLSVFLNSQTSLINSGSSWKYYDQGNINNANWNQLSFNDSGWSSGNAKLGYGDSDSFESIYKLDEGSGKYPTNCPYHKDMNEDELHIGAVYCVMGNSGKTSGTDSEWSYPVMYSYTATEVISTILSVNHRLDVKFHTGNNIVLIISPSLRRIALPFHLKNILREFITYNQIVPKSQKK